VEVEGEGHLEDLHGGELFGGGGVDPDGAQEVLVLETLPEGHSEALAMGGGGVRTKEGRGAPG
jgi:hypothetical protein